MFNIFNQLQSRIVSVSSFQKTIRWLKSPENRLNQPCFGHLTEHLKRTDNKVD